MKKLVDATPYWVKVGTLLVGLIAATTSAAKFVYEVRSDQKLTDYRFDDAVANKQAFNEAIDRLNDMVADQQAMIDSLRKGANAH